MAQLRESLVVQSKRFQRRGMVELKFISLLVICCVMKILVFIMYPRCRCGLMTCLYVIKWYACEILTKFMNGFRVTSLSGCCNEAKKIFSEHIIVRALQQVIEWDQSTIVHYLYYLHMLHYLYVYVRNTTSFKLETSHPPSQRTLFNLAQTPGIWP